MSRSFAAGQGCANPEERDLGGSDSAGAGLRSHMPRSAFLRPHGTAGRSGPAPLRQMKERRAAAAVVAARQVAALGLRDFMND